MPEVKELVVKKGLYCKRFRRPIIDEFGNRCKPISHLHELFGEKVGIEIKILPCLEQDTCIHNQNPLPRGDP